MADQRMGYVEEPARQVPISLETDVVVLGGGPAGIAASAAAARTGAATVLLERYGFLGGMGTAAMVTNFCGLHASINGSVQQIVHGVADEILERLAGLDGLNPPHLVPNPAGGAPTAAQAYDTAAYKLAADELLAAAGVDVRFHTLAVGALGDGERLDAILIETKSGRSAVRARCFVDCSGDADLAAWTGASYEKGSADGFLAYPTTMFRLGNVDDERAAGEGRPRLRDLIGAANESGDFRLPRRAGIINNQAHAGEWRANLTQVTREGAPIDGTDWSDLSYAEGAGRAQVREYFRFLKARVPGFENAYLLETAPQIGIRETRRIAGAYRLSAADVLGCRDFADTIGCNGWPIEQHRRGEVHWAFVEGRGYHQIPYRILLPDRSDNLWVAGRCASASPEGQASIRVSGPCFAMGQAAGTAAALAATQDRGSAEVEVGALQARLARDGAYLG